MHLEPLQGSTPAAQGAIAWVYGVEIAAQIACYS
jgi:hypothetical protein